MQNAILYQAYGGVDYINECRYSLLKYLQVYNLQPPRSTGIYIYTDHSSAFADFLPFLPQLECIPVTEAMVIAWKGPQQFVHRFKIEMIRHFQTRFSGNVLYCDTDTYITAPIEPLFQAIEAGRFFMHQFEGEIDHRRFPAFRKWEKFLSTTPINYSGRQLAFSKSLCMYNAGIIGLQTSQTQLVADVLALSDSVYQQFQKHIAEQFAFSYCLQKAGTIKTAEHLVAHYWNLKEFRKLLAAFFLRNQEESIPSLVKKAHHLDALAIMRDKEAFCHLSYPQRFFKLITGSGWKIERYIMKL